VVELLDGVSQKGIPDHFSDPANRVILFAPALIQALLFGYAANYDVNRVDYAVLDQSKTQASQQLLSRLDGSGIFHRTATLQNHSQIQEVIDQRTALAVISIPSDFEDKLNRAQSSPIQVILDGRNSSTAGMAGTYIANVVNSLNQERLGNITLFNWKYAHGITQIRSPDGELCLH
jgi:ABC-2 type transport system permease protein